MAKTITMNFEGWKSYVLLFFAFTGVIEWIVIIPFMLAGYLPKY